MRKKCLTKFKWMLSPFVAAFLGNTAALAQSPRNANDVIEFADGIVRDLCLANWDTNGDGYFTVGEAAAVASIATVFSEKNNITSFDELQYFTGLTSIPTRAFYYCNKLTSVTLPANITIIGENAFYGCI